MANAAAFASFPTLDPDYVASVLASPPFVTVEGVFNIRDFGALRPSSHSDGPTPRRIRPLHLFRSGETSNITDRGIEQLRALGIRKVFDLRVDREIKRYATPNKPIDGVEYVRAPIQEDVWDPEEIPARLKQFELDEAAAFMQAYTQVLKGGVASLEQVLIHLRDQPDVPCLINCTAGKDRTGVFSALILSLLGANDEDIAADYGLTTAGLQPAIPMLTVRFQKDPIFTSNWPGTINMGSSKPENMRAFLDYVRREHGGVEDYLKAHTSLADDDFRRIRDNFLV
ncbi:tyrosine phosphatase family-domain-containing protein [Trametes elegans]|nr:tyrosine phosphatase family-domain-containing protein [Trametes elegans]